MTSGKGKDFLQATPGRTISYEFVANHLRQLFRSHNIQKIAFDRWNMRHFQPWLIRAGFTEQMIKDRFVEFGQGMQSMSPALRDLEPVGSTGWSPWAIGAAPLQAKPIDIECLIA